MATTQTGATKSPYNNIATETLSGEIQAGPHNTNAANLKIAVQSHIHSLDNTVGRESMKSNFRPPDTGDASNRWRMVCGTSDIDVIGGTGDETVTFATDADQGDPSFTTAPRVTAIGIQHDYILSLASPTTTTVIISAQEANGGTATRTLSIHWIAYGKVA